MLLLCGTFLVIANHKSAIRMSSSHWLVDPIFALELWSKFRFTLNPIHWLADVLGNNHVLRLSITVSRAEFDVTHSPRNDMTTLRGTCVWVSNRIISKKCHVTPSRLRVWRVWL